MSSDLFAPTTDEPRERARVEQKGPRRSRRYEREHPSFRWRTDPADNPRINQVASDLKVSRDHVVSALVTAGLDAIEEGRLVITVEKEIVEGSDKLGRPRSSVATTVSWEWEEQPCS